MSGALNQVMAKMGWRSYSDEEPEYYEDEAAYEPEEEYEPMTVLPRPEVVSSKQPDLSRIKTVRPASYEDARTIGEAFRDGIPVIVNLAGMSETESRRIVDFCAGLTFGLRGEIEVVGGEVLLLSPESVKIENDAVKASRSSSIFD
ncbi:cell division protein SepF [Gleimia hominis]|uniref:Cell division protein SepF n=1 Tax=Gleimia hominis TaxID=595468 RepID=A0ABU3ICJ5_9ACTO|nr:cell division protein SepF [Gleimia hominis]MDT3768100.1 cell division protein SepF [Gleimia hominis]